MHLIPLIHHIGGSVHSPKPSKSFLQIPPQHSIEFDEITIKWLTPYFLSKPKCSSAKKQSIRFLRIMCGS
jgi:hypothetical protein